MSVGDRWCQSNQTGLRHHRVRFKGAREEAGCLEGLKCMKKELLVALLNPLKLLWIYFYRKHLVNMS